ncbi:MAG: type II secretion system F family protein [Candidatus Micrarchaeota archaeon]|nr:type II secretion system F family protein [Candidatus Micrarchaeota archaeon]
MAQKKGKPQMKKEIVGFTKPGKFLFFKTKPKPIYKEVPVSGEMSTVEVKTEGEEQIYEIKEGHKNETGFEKYLTKAISGHKGLDIALKEQGVVDPLPFAKRMFMLSLIIAIAVSAGSAILMISFQIEPALIIIMAPVLAIAGYMGAFNNLLVTPINKTKSVGKEIEKDVLFAARDMIVSMRSGMPLFNAMATISEGYGAASAEFGKIIRLIQVGTPTEQAIEEVSSKSGSRTFQRLMLQASTSIKVGADVVNSIQEVINDVSQERVIELRRYGQRLNAIAMFYMLFGVIFPSMGIAVAAIMSTFISIFTINNTTLIFALVGLGFLQFIFLNMIVSSRPAFST